MVLKIGMLIQNKKHPEWGTWRITKVPTPKENWYHKHGDSGENVLDPGELHFWEIVDSAEIKLKKTKKCKCKK